MDNRRAFLKKTALLAGGITLWETLPLSIQKALAINPAEGSTYLDAEHIVFLMQENRSFDHAFGTLQGVRGFNDPRAISLPDGNPVWLQTNSKGESYCPFRLDMKDTKATWMSSLPHSWESQVDARNNGRMDRWLDAKKGDYPSIPMTMGFYNRADIPFYYALADAFTICDQHFCSSLTGTGPNRLHFWTGTVRSAQQSGAPANVRNEEVDYGAWVNWTTFPERLEAEGVSWKVYQNEVGIDTGLKGEEGAWLSNFTDNPLECFTQYNIRFHPGYQAWAKQAALDLHSVEHKTAEQEKKLAELLSDLRTYTPEAYAALPDLQRRLYENAFVTNKADKDFRKLSTLTYEDGGTQRSVDMPAGDVLFQFREDVSRGKLPSVSWLVAPERFSDHPTSAWYGAWYVSGVLDILTQNPEVWKKTIFILTYDENDGCFDHIPPFVAPHPHKPGTGKTSKGLDTSLEYVFMEQELARVRSKQARESPVGLGYRVPFIVASPWTRGGWVNSEVFDHTSSLQFLEHFLRYKWKKEVRETNISVWRRTVTGNLASVFRPYHGEAMEQPAFLAQKEVIENIHKAKFKGLPEGYKTHEMPRQEPGTRPSCALPYALYAEGALNKGKTAFVVRMEAREAMWPSAALAVPVAGSASASSAGPKASRRGSQAESSSPGAGSTSAPPGVAPQVVSDGAPFLVYAPELAMNRSYAVTTGDTLSDDFPLAASGYHFCVYGPNGFFRAFKGDAGDPEMGIACHYLPQSGDIELHFTNKGSGMHYDIHVSDPAYKKNDKRFSIDFGRDTHGNSPFVLQLDGAGGWYDVAVRVEGFEAFEVRYAGRVETGKPGITDPFMGGVVV